MLISLVGQSECKRGWWLTCMTGGGKHDIHELEEDDGNVLLLLNNLL